MTLKILPNFPWAIGEQEAAIDPDSFHSSWYVAGKVAMSECPNTATE